MGLRNWLLDKGSDVLGKKTYSWKTKAVGIGLILTGLVGVIGKVWADPNLPQMGWDEIIYSFSAGLAALGINAKIEKSREENRILSQRILEASCPAKVTTSPDIQVHMTPPSTGGTPAQTPDLGGTAPKWDGTIKDSFGPGRGN